MSFHKTLLAGLLIASLAGCGHGGKSTATTQNNGVVTNANRSSNAMAPGTLATVPPTLQCGAVQPVWVNLKSHVYHLQSDPLYGRTKHGEYMCPSAAKAQGYHPARSKAKSSAGGT